MSHESVESRLSALETDVARLREQLSESASSTATGTQSRPELWALEGLEARAPEGGAIIYLGSVDTPTGGVVRWQYGLSGKEIFERDWAEQAEALTALGNPVRLRILHAVLHGVTSAAQLVEEVDAGTSGQVYHHLKELTASGWLASPKRGTFEVPVARIVPLLAILLAAGTP